ncbi:MAG TPA: hypothetical protein P5526_03055 [Anaerolineae bacterium]|nr:hypothetical protein [Anaerolineae bacterium]MCB0176942.1 hypothetical protein [Anaerolineae bacterium]MCB0226010.1 hypothetical protein [Anaerolineae bacterium]MCB9102761.1 hypothetical protein [Anaerolineales bacterium]HRV91123.1 hypothetical protein [Anaerolineae bacterium]
MTIQPQPLLSKEEIESLAVALSEGQGDFTEDDFFVLVKWAEGIKLDIGLLQNVIDGNLSVKVENGRVHFALTPQGLQTFAHLRENRNNSTNNHTP